jgi:putative FmdB family regulatory protein
MPTYDYRCDACGHALEIFQSISEPAKKKCPKCGKSKLVRLIGAGAGFLFKGGGFYLTDYRSQSYKAGEKASNNAEPAVGASGDVKAPKPDASQSDSSKSESSKSDSSQSESSKPPAPEPKAKKSSSKKRAS